jgi:hypothetical protein
MTNPIFAPPPTEPTKLPYSQRVQYAHVCSAQVQGVVVKFFIQPNEKLTPFFFTLVKHVTARLDGFKAVGQVEVFISEDVICQVNSSYPNWKLEKEYQYDPTYFAFLKYPTMNFERNVYIVADEIRSGVIPLSTEVPEWVKQLTKK